MNNNSEDHIFEGVFTANPKGFGFVTVEGQENDFFVPEKEKNGAFHMDTVRIKVMQDPRSTRTMATVLKTLSHEITQLVGTFRKNSEGGYVTADNRKIVDDIFISRALSHGARENDKVVVQITSYGGRGMKPAGRVLRILGNSSEPGVDILSVICSEDLPVEFPEDVRKEACSLPKTVSRSSWKGRMDLRDLQTVTVDGEDTKDFDDAVSLTFDGKNYHLGVHIADVAEYVKEGSLLDQEALKRGTSVYLPDRVIPMLPLELSNGICSRKNTVICAFMTAAMAYDPKAAAHQTAGCCDRLWKMFPENTRAVLMPISFSLFFTGFIPVTIRLPAITPRATKL